MTIIIRRRVASQSMIHVAKRIPSLLRRFLNFLAIPKIETLRGICFVYTTKLLSALELRHAGLDIDVGRAALLAACC